MWNWSRQDPGFVSQAVFYVSFADNGDALHRDSFRHGAPLFFDFVFFQLVVEQAAINLQAIGGLRLVARRILQDFAN